MDQIRHLNKSGVGIKKGKLLTMSKMKFHSIIIEIRSRTPLLFTLPVRGYTDLKTGVAATRCPRVSNQYTATGISPTWPPASG